MSRAICAGGDAFTTLLAPGLSRFRAQIAKQSVRQSQRMVWFCHSARRGISWLPCRERWPVECGCARSALGAPRARSPFLRSASRLDDDVAPLARDVLLRASGVLRRCGSWSWFLPYALWDQGGTQGSLRE